MTKLILKSVLFCSLLGGAYFLLVDRLSQGFVDMYYPKFTQEAGSLIIGLSRADQGIDPQILEDRLQGDGCAMPMVNFAANQNYFGEVYHRAIQEKLGPIKGQRVFIVSVSPGSFSAPKGFGDKGIRTLDGKMAIGKAGDFTSKPNYNYIMNCYGMGLYTALIDDRGWANLVSHENGWNELSLEAGSSTISRALMLDWKKQNLAYYDRQLHKSEIKAHRKEWFLKTLDHLKGEGTVYLIRMPVDTEILEFETQSWPGFTAYINSISHEKKIPYFDYTQGPGTFATYDGSHLHGESAKAFTELLARDIVEHRRKHLAWEGL